MQPLYYFFFIYVDGIFIFIDISLYNDKYISNVVNYSSSNVELSYDTKNNSSLYFLDTLAHSYRKILPTYAHLKSYAASLPFYSRPCHFPSQKMAAF